MYDIFNIAFLLYTILLITFFIIRYFRKAKNIFDHAKYTINLHMDKHHTQYVYHDEYDVHVHVKLFYKILTIFDISQFLLVYTCILTILINIFWSLFYFNNISLIYDIYIMLTILLSFNTHGYFSSEIIAIIYHMHIINSILLIYHKTYQYIGYILINTITIFLTYTFNSRIINTFDINIMSNILTILYSLLQLIYTIITNNNQPTKIPYVMSISSILFIIFQYAHAQYHEFAAENLKLKYITPNVVESNT